MIRRLCIASRVVLLLGAVGVSGCEGPPRTGQAQADAETRAACETRANQAYDQQNRAEIYSPQPQVNTPYSTNYIPGDTNRGLSELFVHDRMVSDCVRNTGTGTERSVPQGTVSGAVSAAPQPR
jgi:hypothetical protein